MIKNYKFKIQMFVLDIIQKIALRFGAYIRPARVYSVDFIANFLEAKCCGVQLIQIGNGGDGTYIVPNDLVGINKCFSPGVGPSSQFEEVLYDKYGIRSYLIDASVQSVPTTRSDFYTFERQYLGASTYDDYISLKDWIEKQRCVNKTEDMLLQMDIEGSEFASLLACPTEILDRFRIIALEIHFLDALNLNFFSSIVEQTFRKLDENFVVVYAHPNDCCGAISVGRHKFPRVIEITLLRKDRIQHDVYVENQSFFIKNT